VSHGPGPPKRVRPLTLSQSARPIDQVEPASAMTATPEIALTPTNPFGRGAPQYRVKAAGGSLMRSIQPPNREEVHAWYCRWTTT
jgi:hypothetical protein